MSSGTTELLLLHKHSVAIVFHMQIVLFLEIVLFDGFKTLTNILVSEMHKNREALDVRLTKKKETLIILSDTPQGLNET